MPAEEYFRVHEVDPHTWLPVREVKGVESFCVKRSTSDDAPLLESGDMDASEEITEGYYRVTAMTASGEAVDVATLLMVPDGATYSYQTWGGGVSGKSVLTPASERRFRPGSYVPKGTDGAAYCARLLREVIAAPVSVEGSFALGDHVVHDLGQSYLDGIWEVLDAGAFCIQIAGNGTVNIRPKPIMPALTISTSERGMLMPEIGRSYPIEDVPNVLKVYDVEQEAEARNDDPASPTSTVARGRVIEEVEESPTRKEGETLANYAIRRLAELSDVYETLDVEREHVAGIMPYSVIEANLPEAGISGTFRVMSQTIECELGMKVGETWGRMG